MLTKVCFCCCKESESFDINDNTTFAKNVVTKQPNGTGDVKIIVTDSDTVSQTESAQEEPKKAEIKDEEKDKTATIDSTVKNIEPLFCMASEVVIENEESVASIHSSESHIEFQYASNTMVHTEKQQNNHLVTVDVHKSDDDDKESDVTEEETVRIENTLERELTPEPTFTEPIQPNPKDIIKSEAKEIEDHEYEDIYSVKGRDSGSHSRSGSLSSASSHIVISDSPESGVSSPSPSELGKSESEENEKSKLEQRHSLPHQTQNSRTLKRVVSVPTNMCPPPPPPPPPEDSPSLPSTPASSPHISLAPVHSSPQKEEERPPHQNSENTASQIGHLVNKQMVLPFIPPKFPSPLDPEGLIKPSEYLRSLQSGSPQGEASPPAPPLPPPPPPQPLSTITIQDIASVQLRRTKAAKTMSCPPASLAGTDTPFQAQKEDLIAELKMSKDISGIKKLKVERTKLEEKAGKEIATEISKQFSVDHFVEKMPEKDAAGNPIPPWKRQMLAKKAAEKAKKEMEEQLAKEAEARRLQAIPAWKRHLLQKKGPVPNGTHQMEDSKASPTKELPENKENNIPPEKPLMKSPEKIVVKQPEKTVVKPPEKKEEEREVIIPWRAQLRKTNSTLNLLE